MKIPRDVIRGVGVMAEGSGLAQLLEDDDFPVVHVECHCEFGED